ncbi:MAG TPA: hypothetical protein VF515_05900 [Candidatus Binatia bacterium]
MSGATRTPHTVNLPYRLVEVPPSSYPFRQGLLKISKRTWEHSAIAVHPPDE